MRKVSLHSVAVAVAVIALAACAAKKPVKTALRPAAASPLAAPEADARGFQFHSTPELRTVRFAYDAARLDGAAREILKSNAAAMEKNQEWTVLVEGHCDERGTTEYNLALGQRRAKAVREYYILLGVPGERLATRSFGSEAPSCGKSSEVCWRENRRAESKVRTTLASTPGPTGS